jgi:hypothetical protein
MRMNLARKTPKGLADKFMKETLRGFASEFDFTNINSASEYVMTGKQGLTAFVDYLKSIGYSAETYHLDPNKDLFMDVGDKWGVVSRTSPSFGFVIPENDPKLVEFKLRHG